MDVLIRFYDETKHEVTTHYLTSAFLSTASAIDILNAFKASLNSVPIPLSKILQVSMDGPNVNWSFMEKLTSEMAIDTDNGPAILNMGSCGLHVIHGAFQTGHCTGKWNVNQILNCAYYAFADSPARRASFTCITGSQTFPLKFCRTRWVENSRVASRFLEQLTYIKKFIETYKTSKNASHSLKVLREAVDDPLLRAKLTFFVSMASEVEPFLIRFQSSTPLAPFLFEACESI